MTAPATLTDAELGDIERHARHELLMAGNNRVAQVSVRCDSALALVSMARRTAEAEAAYERLDMVHAQLIGMHTAQKNRVDDAEQRAAGLSEQVEVLREVLKLAIIDPGISAYLVWKMRAALAATVPEPREDGR